MVKKITRSTSCLRFETAKKGRFLLLLVVGVVIAFKYARLEMKKKIDEF
jgi:hypothetical protein